MSKKLLFLTGIICGFLYGSAQLNVTISPSAAQLAQMIAGPGITISNAICTAPVGAAGTFSGHSSLGLDTGVVITNGYVNNIPGPNNQLGATGAWGVIGTDTQFAGFLGVPVSNILDESTLEFDFQSTGDSISFKYVFGSEEYPEYVCSQFNDAFAFFISGPGISGLKNIALIPGTNLPVTINSVNPGTPGADAGGKTCNLTNQSLAYSQYYVSNGTGSQAPYNTDPYYIQYNGITTPLNASMSGLRPNQTYHAKLVIADLIDATFDSGIFIEAGGFTTALSNSYLAKLNSPYSNDSLSAIAVGGCSNAFIPVQLLSGDTDSTVVHLTITGTAVNGTDYNAIPDSVVFHAGDSIEIIKIQPIGYQPNVVKTVIISMVSGAGYFADTVLIIDTLEVIVTPHDTAICVGNVVNLSASGPTGLSWTPDSSLSDSAGANTVAYPYVTTTYTCTGTVGSCASFDTARINILQVIPFVFSVSPKDTSICFGATVNLLASGASGFLWTPVNGLSEDTGANPVARPSVTTQYICSAIENGCAVHDTVLITILPAPASYLVVTPHSTRVCSTDSLQLAVSGGYGNYLWTPNTGLSNDTIAYPIAKPTATTTYICTSSNGNCSYSDSAIVVFVPNALLNLTVSSSKSVVCSGDTVYLHASGGGTTFNWQPTTGLPVDTGSNIIATPVDTTTYTCTTSDGICSATASVYISMLPPQAPPTITQRGDTLISSAASGYQWYFNSAVLAGDTGSFIVATETGIYVVETTNDYDCHGYSQQGLVYTISGIQSFDKSPARLYPNPNNGNFVIEFADKEEREVSVTDLLGQQILPFTKVVQRQEFDFSSFSDGIYLLKIERVDNSGSTVFKQVVIQR
jgi:hypothetical protein